MANSENFAESAAQKLEGFKGRLKDLIGSESVRSYSRRCGISEATIRGYLEGKNMPTLEKIILLADAGGESVEWLSTGRASITKEISPTSLKTAEMIEQLSEESQREILLRIKALHKSDKRELEISEMKEMLQALLERSA